MFTTLVPANPTPVSPPQNINYLDATSGSDGNTTLADGSTFSPPLNGTTGADNNWEERTPYASGGTVFEAGGETAEDAPELRTIIAGLTPGARYAIYAFFWDANGTTENWSIRAGFAPAPGANPLYAASDASASLVATSAVLASTLTYSAVPTIFAESNRQMLAASLGAATADGNGEIKVFIDDKPSTIGANNRTWYDGVGYARLVATNPTNITFSATRGQLTLSWPPDHTGWSLQVQTNALSAGTNWAEVAGSTNVNEWVIPLNAIGDAAFFRLVYP